MVRDEGPEHFLRRSGLPPGGEGGYPADRSDRKNDEPDNVLECHKMSIGRFPPALNARSLNTGPFREVPKVGPSGWPPRDPRPYRTRLRNLSAARRSGSPLGSPPMPARTSARVWRGMTSTSRGDYVPRNGHQSSEHGSTSGVGSIGVMTDAATPRLSQDSLGTRQRVGLGRAEGPR